MFQLTEAVGLGPLLYQSCVSTQKLSTGQAEQGYWDVGSNEENSCVNTTGDE